MAGTLPRLRALPWSLIGALLLIVLVECAVSSFAFTLTSDSTHLAWRFAGRAAALDAKDAKVLCLGDSLVKLGIQPRALEARMGRRAYNLAIEASSAPSAYFVLCRALDAGAHPRALVIDYHEQVLPTPARTYLDYWPELITAREALELGWYARDRELAGATLARLSLSTLKHRQALRTALWQIFQRRNNRATTEVLADRLRNWQENQGAMAYPKAAPPPEEPLPRARRGRWSPSPVNVHYVRAFLDLAASREIPVFWLMPPLTPSRQRRLEFQGHDARFVAFVRTLQREYPGLYVIDGRHANYPHTVFIDATHLDREGALELSSAVAGVITARLDGARSPARWLDLPAYSRQPSAVPLADLNPLRMAYREQAGTFRR